MEFYLIVVFVLFTAGLNASVTITLMVWMEPNMIFSGYRYWLAKNLLPLSENKEAILSELVEINEADVFISVYKETEKLGYLTAENWLKLNAIGRGVLCFDVENEIENVFELLNRNPLPFNEFVQRWGVCPIEDVESKEKGISFIKEKMIELAKRETFWYKPLGGCSDCYHVWLCPFTFSVCLGLYLTYSPFSFWLIPSFFGCIFISGLFVSKLNK